MVDYNLMRTFWHEFGHFTTHYWNKHYYGMDGVQAIRITRHNHGNDYEGETVLLKPPDDIHESSMPSKYPAQIIASLSYGCYFQSIYLSEPFCKCFDGYGRGHGCCDVQMVRSLIDTTLREESHKKVKVWDCINGNYDLIKNNCEFKDLFINFKNNILPLIRKKESFYEVDINLLEKKFQYFLIKHKPAYLLFVEKLQQYFT